MAVTIEWWELTDWTRYMYYQTYKAEMDDAKAFELAKGLTL